MDAFAVLGLPYTTDLDDEDVRRAYLVRLRAVHPDNGSAAAYDALRSGVRRGELLAAAPVDRGSRPADQARAPRQAAGQAAGQAAPADGVAGAGGGAAGGAGVPPFVTDEAVLSMIADLLVVMRLGAGARAKHYPRSAGSAPPGWDAPWWDEDAGQARRPREASSWRLARRRRRRAREREVAEAAQPPDVLSGSWGGRAWARVRFGRPWLLVAKVVAAAAVPLAAWFVVPADPAVPTLAVGSFTRLMLTGRFDLAGGSRC